MAPFGDVLNALENARQSAWLERSPHNPAGSGGGVGTSRGHRGSSIQGAGLPNSHSQPIYVPGKYSVSYKTRENSNKRKSVNSRVKL